MFLGLLIGLAIWGWVVAYAHRASAHTTKHKQMIATSDPKVLASVRLHGMMSLIGLLAFLLGTCGAVGWVVEVIAH